MSSPSTPSRRSSRLSRSSSRLADEAPSSELAQPLPQSSPRASSAAQRRTLAPPEASEGPSGPGSVSISEIDLSSPLNYGTPLSIASSNFRTPMSANPLRTPIRLRADIHSEKVLRQVSLTPAGPPIPDLPPSEAGTPRRARGPPSEVVPPSDCSDSAFQVIWGTDVNMKTVKERFLTFLTTYVPKSDNEDHAEVNDQPFYLRELEEINSLGLPYLNLDCSYLQDFNEDLYRQLICYPQEVIPFLDMTVNELFWEKYDTVLAHQIQVRPFNADKTKNMRTLNPEDVDQLITIDGMVIRTSNLVPEMKEAFFQCSVCQFTVTVAVEMGRIAEPTLCTKCNANHSFTLVHNRCEFTDKQMVKLQESPDDMPPGQTPHTVVLYAHENLVDVVNPGDRVSVTGVYRAVSTKVNPKMRNIRSVFKSHIDVVHFRKTDNRRLHDGDKNSKDELNFDPERIELLKALSEKPDAYEQLARAIAPLIYENEDVKKGILLQMFGGSKKDLSSAGRNSFRSEVNILLCGDPGTSKSQLLQYVYNLVPRSQYTSGKGSSAVGLTAYITKDPESRQLVLQTGALVLADNGICCIDEFDKMNDSTRSILHEVMEQQTLSIAKAGIICQLNARTSILAAANPIESQWNNKKTIVENIQLPHTLMSRFDLIFLILDPQDETFDKRLGRHLVSLYYHTNEQADDEQLSMDILRDYIAYAKYNFNPQLSKEAGSHLIQAYVNMREIGNRRGRITAYPRQLESLIRLAEAHAKMRLSNTVELVDVEEADRLHQEALKQSATDPKSGTINLDILTTGQSESYRMRREEIKKVFKELIKKKGKVQTLNYQATWQNLKDNSDVVITREMYEDALKDLSDEGILTLTGRATIRVNAS